MRPISRFLHRVVQGISGEFLLTWPHRQPNGGTIIVLRALLVAFLLYGLAISIDQRLEGGNTWAFSASALRVALKDTLPWFGGIFTVVYAALYTRFSSQWTYLAGVYNQIKAAETRLETGDADSNASLVAWKAAFIEDADELHLALKPMYASLIEAWCENERVQAEFIRTAPGGKRRLTKLLTEVDAALTEHARTYGEPDNSRRIQRTSSGID